MSFTENIKLYSFDNLISKFKTFVKILPDTRQGLNKSYSIADAALSAFSVFFMQSGSFLAHQSAMQKIKSHNNAESLFQVNSIPSDNQIRNLLDPIAPSNITPMFDYVFNGLNSNGYFKNYRSINKTILIALDGVNYFSSNKIHCAQCNTQNHKNGQISYLHKAITPVIVAPDNPRVVSLAPEFITPQDGHDKQDGENAAAKRWLLEHGHKYKDLNVTILGDDLYSHQPICEAIKQEGFHFVLNCKPDSHKMLYKSIKNLNVLDEINLLKVERIEGKKTKKKYIDIYRFVNRVPLRSSTDSLIVNWCELETIDSNGERKYINSYITDHKITSENVIEIITAARARWKIENENNNVLKNHGYHLKHNFGHGKQYLSQLLLTFNLLSFLFHTTLSITDEKYKSLRGQLPTRKIFFEHVRTLTIYMFFNNWDDLLEWMLNGLKNKHHVRLTVPDTS